MYRCGWYAYARICEFACTCEYMSAFMLHEYVCSCNVCICVSLFTDMGVCISLYVHACLCGMYNYLCMHVVYVFVWCVHLCIYVVYL